MDTLRLGYLDILARTNFVAFENDPEEGRVAVTYDSEDDVEFALKVLGSFWP